MKKFVIPALIFCGSLSLSGCYNANGCNQGCRTTTCVSSTSCSTCSNCNYGYGYGWY